MRTVLVSIGKNNNFDMAYLGLGKIAFEKGEYKPEFSLAPVAKRLGEILGCEVKMAKDVIGEDAQLITFEINADGIVTQINTATSSSAMRKA